MDDLIPRRTHDRRQFCTDSHDGLQFHHDAGLSGPCYRCGATSTVCLYTTESHTKTVESTPVRTPFCETCVQPWRQAFALAALVNA